MDVDVSKILNYPWLYKFKCKCCELGYYYPEAAGSDAFYSRLAEWEWYYGHEGKTEYSIAASLVATDNKVIDVGCGIGELLTHLPSDAVFFGVELSSRSVEIAKSLNRNVRQVDITKAPPHFKNNFDVVTCFQVLEHIVDIHSFFSALISLCKPGGIIVLAVPNNDGFVGRAVNNILNMPPHHVLLWNKKSLYFLAKRHNLVIYDYVEEPLSQVHRYWGFTVLVNSFLIRVMRISSKTVDVSFTGKIFSKLSSMLARPLSKVFPRLILSGHSSILVLRKPLDEKL